LQYLHINDSKRKSDNKLKSICQNKYDFKEKDENIEAQKLIQHQEQKNKTYYSIYITTIAFGCLIHLLFSFGQTKKKLRPPTIQKCE
jgi:hypothetical protein